MLCVARNRICAHNTYHCTPSEVKVALDRNLIGSTYSKRVLIDQSSSGITTQFKPCSLKNIRISPERHNRSRTTNHHYSTHVENLFCLPRCTESTRWRDHQKSPTRSANGSLACCCAWTWPCVDPEVEDTPCEGGGGRCCCGCKGCCHDWFCGGCHCSAIPPRLGDLMRLPPCGVLGSIISPK